RDSTAYYWRVAAVPNAPSDEPVWNSASFIYLPGNHTGLNQSHYYQFQNASYQNMTLHESRTFIYDSLRSEIMIKTVSVEPGTAIPISDISLQIDGIIVQQGALADMNGVNPNERSIRFYLIDNR